jgi:hypothetical protein
VGELGKLAAKELVVGRLLLARTELLIEKAKGL